MGLVKRFLPIPIFAFSWAFALATRPEVPAEARRPVLVRVGPAYPELARRMHICGNVILVVEVLPDGSVGETRVESGHALLRQAAEDAVRHWRFAPGPPTALSIAVSFVKPTD